QDNFGELSGAVPRARIGIAKDAVAQLHAGPPSPQTIGYIEDRMRILDEVTLPADQRDWIRGLFGVGPFAGRLGGSAAPAAAAATKPAAPPGASGMVPGTSGKQAPGATPNFGEQIAQEVFHQTFAERVAEYQQIKAFGRTTFVHPDFGTHLLAADAAARPAIEAHE